MRAKEDKIKHKEDKGEERKESKAKEERKEKTIKRKPLRWGLRGELQASFQPHESHKIEVSLSSAGIISISFASCALICSAIKNSTGAP